MSSPTYYRKKLEEQKKYKTKYHLEVYNKYTTYLVEYLYT